MNLRATGSLVRSGKRQCSLHNRVVHGTTPPPFVAAIASGVRDAGGRAFVVGGWVRDRLMSERNRSPQTPEPDAESPKPKDIDMEVFGIPADQLPELLAAFGRVEAVGQSFPVYKVIGADGVAIDVALPRRESKRGRGHKGFEVRGDPFMSLEEAARRRDFTINAISWDPLTHEYVDPRRGRDDLDRRLLRAVDPQTFGDDSLRALRAMQFAARFDFSLDEGTAALCRSIRLDDLPPERVWGEMEKLLLQAARPSIGFRLALDLGDPRTGPAGDGAPRRLRAGAGVASRRRRLDPHAHGDRSCARDEWRSRSPPAAHGDAGRRVSRSREAGDHRTRRRTDPLAGPRAGGRRADRSACSTG